LSPAAAAQDSLGARQLLDQANVALRRNDVRTHEALLRRAWAATGSSEDRADVSVALGNLLWRIKHDPVKAREILKAGTDTAKPVRTLLELTRLESAESDFSAARLAARDALSKAAGPLEAVNAKIAFAGTVAEEILRCAIDRKAPAGCAVDDALVREALEMVDPIVHQAPALPRPSRIDLLLTLQNGDGPRALRAWQAYFRIAADEVPPAPLTEPTAVLRRLLPSLTPDSGSGDRQQIVQALAASRLFPEAAALAVRWKLEQDKNLRNVVEYARWIREVKLRLDEDYRQRALGHGDDRRSHALFTSQAEVLSRTLGWSSPTAKFELSRFSDALDAQFGAVFRLRPGGTSFGHRVRDEDLRIDQYGRTATLRFIVLDSMVSNAFISWLWDGRASIGGWADGPSANSPATIVEIRTDSAISAWNAVTEPTAIRRSSESIERLSKEDEQRAAKHPYAYLPGLSARMTREGRLRLLNRLQAAGLTGDALRAAFVTEYEKARLAAGIVAHEGRHALDLLMIPGLTSEELEFRAKLSEVAFAPEPLLALGGIFDSNIGLVGDSHGIANERIMKGLVSWMTTHGSSIAPVNFSRPLLPQFDSLTDDQIRAAFRSMDPWASNGTGTLSRFFVSSVSGAGFFAV